MAPSTSQIRSRSSRKTHAPTVSPSIPRISSSFSRVSKSSSVKSKSHIGKENDCSAKGSPLERCLSSQTTSEAQKPALCEIQTEISSRQLPASEEAKSRVSVKRKRGEAQDEDDGHNVSVRQAQDDQSGNKKLKLATPQLLTPPSSEHGTDTELSRSPIKSIFRSGRRNAQSRRPHLKVHFTPTKVDMPETLQNFISMHAAFLKALSLHFAHNGPSTPAELGDLMSSTTRIWKKATVTKTEIQQMLALYELGLDSNLRLKFASGKVKQVDWKYSPFKVVTSGLGYNVRTNVEYAESGDFSGASEQTQQRQYEDLVLRVYQSLTEDGSSLVYDSLAAFPTMILLVGTQTQISRTKAFNTRAEILSKSKAGKSAGGQPDLSFSSLSISDGTNEEQEEHVTATVKSRTLSLFDRVRAKNQLRSNTATPSSAQITRRHAIDRIPEVVEYLRMKQSQKQQVVQPAARNSFLSDLDLDDGSSYRPTYRRQQHPVQISTPAPTTPGKISFSLAQVVREIRESVPVPIGEEEIRVVVKILAKEIPSELKGWVQTFQLGSVTSVTLTGSGIGMSGLDVRRLVEEKEKAKL